MARNFIAYFEYVLALPCYRGIAMLVSERDMHDYLLVAAPGQGNIGDQAMLESVLENVSGPVTVVVRRGEDIAVPAAVSSRVTVVELPHLIYGKFGIEHLRDVRRYVELLLACSEVALIGA